MNIETANSQLEEALSLSKKMLSMAENQEWENIESTLKSRDELLQKLANTSQDLQFSDEENKKLSDSFKQIRDIQQKIQLLAEKTQNNIKSTLKNSQKNSKALKSYNANR